jgi:hypothetical protein
MGEESPAGEGAARDPVLDPEHLWPLDDVALRTVALLLRGAQVLQDSLPPSGPIRYPSTLPVWNCRPPRRSRAA